MSRLTIEISPKQHQHIKALAAMEGQSIKDYVLQRLIPKTNNDEDDYAKFKSFIKDRIVAADNGELSSRTAQQIADDVLGKRS